MAARTSLAAWRLQDEWRDAPEKLHHLAEEIRHSRRIFEQLKNLFDAVNSQESDRTHGFRDALISQIMLVTPIWVELERNLQSIIRKSSGGDSRIRRVAWMARQASLVKFQMLLKNVRFNVVEIVLVHLWCRQSQKMANIIRSTNIRIEGTANSQHGVTTHRLERLEEALNEMMSKLDSIRSNHGSVISNGWPDTTNIASTLAGIQPCGQTSSIIRLWPTGDIRHITCNCLCHTAQAIGSWCIGNRTANSFMGRLNISYKFLPFIGTTCGSQSCCRRVVRRVSVKFSLPHWLFSVCISLFFSVSAYGEPTFGLAIRRRIPPEFEILSKCILGLVTNGNVDALKVALQRREMSVNDVRDDTGRSALFIAVDDCYTNISEILKLLIDAGADPFLETDAGTLPISQALMRIVSPETTPETRHALKQLFPWSSYFDSYDFPMLHQVVLGHFPISLEQSIQDSKFRNQINFIDHTGCTALHWAAASGSRNAVQTLVSAGADVNASSKDGVRPLMNACFSNSIDCVRILLDAGANVNTLDSTQGNVTMFAAQHADPALLQILISSGARIDALDMWNCAPFDHAAGWGNVPAMKYLLKQGAQLNRMDWEGDTPLTHAIHWYAYDSISWLLEQRADHCIITYGGFSILHKVALVGDTKIARMLATAKLKGLNHNAKENKGRTARDIMYSRLEVEEDEEFRIAFEELIESVIQVNSSADEDFQCFQEESDDEYLDAVEIQG